MCPNPFNINKLIPGGFNSNLMASSSPGHILPPAFRPEKFLFMADTMKKRVSSMTLLKPSSMICHLTGHKSKSDPKNQRIPHPYVTTPYAPTRQIWSYLEVRKTCCQITTPFTNLTYAPTNGNPLKQNLTTIKSLKSLWTHIALISGVLIYKMKDNNMYVYGGYES